MTARPLFAALLVISSALALPTAAAVVPPVPPECAPGGFPSGIPACAIALILLAQGAGIKTGTYATNLAHYEAAYLDALEAYLLATLGPIEDQAIAYALYLQVYALVAADAGEAFALAFATWAICVVFLSGCGPVPVPGLPFTPAGPPPLRMPGPPPLPPTPPPPPALP